MPRFRHLALLPLLLASAASAGSKDDKAAGAEVFKTYGCAQCHNADLSGSDKGPDLRGVGKRLHKFDIYQQVHNGGGGMPAFGDVIQEEQLVQLVEYLRAQTKGPKVKKQYKSLLNPDPPVPPKPVPDKEE